MIELLKALRKARNEFPPVVKDQENPFFHSKYAALDSIIRAVTPALDDNDLTLLAYFDVIDGKSAVCMELHHDSGESLPKSTLLIPVKRVTKTDSKTGEVTITEDNPQDVGSGISYMVRYSIKTYLGLPLEDDDGNRASGNRRQSQEEDPKSAALANIQKGEEELTKKPEITTDKLRGEFFDDSVARPVDLTTLMIGNLEGYLAFLRKKRDSQPQAEGKSGAGEKQKPRGGNEPPTELNELRSLVLETEMENKEDDETRGDYRKRIMGKSMIDMSDPVEMQKYLDAMAEDEVGAGSDALNIEQPNDHT